MIKPVLPLDIRKSAERQAMLCKVFSNAQRVLILWLLAEKERTVTEIASAIGASLQSTSQHLRLMELSNLVESRREHHNIYYQIARNDLINNCLVLTNRPKQHLFEIESEA
jgi:ArsR family transcriptional regulator, virulence genes transcriptional regulator